MQKIGLALEGGGLKGSYQIGSYYAFKDCHIKISGIVGTSIGAFNAAAIACGNETQLLKFWQQIKPGEILGINKEVIKYFNGEKISLNFLKGLKSTTMSILKNHGIDTSKMRKIGQTLVNPEKLRSSPMDFGLTTVKFRKLTPLYMYKEEISDDKLIDSIIASCYLPVFRLDPVIDNHIYIDGGFYDNCPSRMLVEKNYDIVYEIRINGIGFNRPHLDTKTKIITISPSRNLCSIFEMNSSNISENILMGYYDTVRYLKNYDGKKYVFKKLPDFLIKHLLRKVSTKELKRIKSFFNVKTKREAIIYSLEYVLEKEHINYYHIYNIIKVIHVINHKYENENFVYQFINKLRIF